jgi:hypothetical protein
MTDDDTILGNLPRSRPGTRSEKRSDSPGKGAEKPARRASTSQNPRSAAKSRSARAGGTRPSTRSAPAGTRGRAAGAAKRPAPEQPAPAPSRPPDPVGDVVRAAETATRAGLRVASALANEAVRRLRR